MAENPDLITRREAVLRVTAFLGGVTLVGGSALLTACERRDERAVVQAGAPAGSFTPDDVAFLDEVADTILPDTKTPGAKAAKTGAFIALMVTDTYGPDEQRIFRDGMRAVDAESRKAYGTGFMKATPQQRLTLLERLDREQKRHTDAVQAARERKKAESRGAVTMAGQSKGDKYLPDQRKENAPAPDASAAPAITADSPPHYFRMMKELTLLGYFTSEIGCMQAQRYVETPGRFDPCVPYHPGDRAWAAHA